MLEWLAVLLFVTICLANAVLLGNISRIVGPHRPTAAKLSPYESGMPPIGPAHQRYTVRYYLIAMLFVIFDIEVIFIIPWAVRFQSLGVLGLIEMLVFIGILLVGLWYAWKKGALEWD